MHGSNSWGRLFSLRSFGESHGPAMGGILQGYPSGVKIDVDFIQKCLDKRKPGQKNTSPRKEKDKIQILSGVFKGKSTGHPIGFLIENQNQKSKDYEKIKDIYRPSHADFTYDIKYGFRDYRGGGRSSARETANWVVAGAFAQLLLKKYELKVNASISQIGDLKLKGKKESRQKKIMAYLSEIKRLKDTVGGIIECETSRLPIGLGEPVFDKLSARLAHAMFCIPSVKGFDMGSGFKDVHKKGSELNDSFVVKNNQIEALNKNSGGVLGGISNGQQLQFRVAFKPVSSHALLQKSVTKQKTTTDIQIAGRHDPSVLLRALPVVEALTWMVIADFYLLNKLSNSKRF